MALTKKRGVCESPFDNFDDMSPGSFSVSRMSEYSRLKTRIFSPLPSRVPEFTLTSAGKKNKQSMEVAMDIGGDTDAKSNNDSVNNASVESGSNCPPLLIPG